MSGKPAGQLAYEAFRAWREERDPMMICTDWTHPAVAREGWEAAAAAVETEQLRLAREDRDQLRKAVLGLAGEWKDDAAADENRVRPETGSAIRARIRNQCADDLRHAAEPPS